MFSKFFIERPIFANVLAIVTMLIGVVALRELPVEQYPEITPPTVRVSASYPGADAEVLVDTVAAPIEQQVNGVENMLYMDSTSSADGSYSLTVTFEIGTNLDDAQVLVQNRVALAEPLLPEEVRRQGVSVRKQSTNLLMIMSLVSPDEKYDNLFLSNFATLRLRDELSRVEGVGDVTVFGTGAYSMRIWLDPQKMEARRLTTVDVLAAIQEQNVQVAAGRLGQPPAPAGLPFQYTVRVLGRLSDVDQFENIVVKTGDGVQATYLKDVARVELGAQTYDQFNLKQGKPTANIGIYQLPGGNAIETAEQVRAAMERLKGSFPEGLQYEVPLDTTAFVAASIHEVYKTLLEAGVLVILVILVFLQDWRAMLIPATTVPVTIVGAFAAMAALGFTVNILTLFGLVLAIGIVVDDAIVIVENVSHHLEQGLAPKEATIKAMSEVLGPIIGITLVLLAVFIPSAFLGGITGRLYRQFALTIAATALISAINAVTLKPAQSALWMRPHKAKRNAAARAFNAVYDRLEGIYAGMVRFFVRHVGPVMIAFAVLIGLTVWAYRQVPTGFFPTEDQGYFFVSVQLPDAASQERTAAVMRKIDGILTETPGVADWITIGGLSLLDGSNAPNTGTLFVTMKDWGERLDQGLPLEAVLGQVGRKLGTIEDAVTFPFPPPAIRGLGVRAGFQIQIEDRSNVGSTELAQVTEGIVEKARTQTGLSGVNSTYRAGVPQYFVDIDRNKVKALGVPLATVFSTLQSYLGSAYINDFNKFGRTYQVRTQAEASYRAEPDDIERLQVRNVRGEMLPIGTLADVRKTVGPQVVNRHNLYRTAAITGEPAAGYSSGDALGLMEEIAGESMPASMGYDWSGLAFQEVNVRGGTLPIFGFAVLLVYLVLAAQYENWLTPLAVILIVPLGVLGAMAAVWVRGMDNNLFTQIGIVLIIALASKNAILIVEFARDLHAAGKPRLEAAVEAARLRFRPILMTSFAFILGVVPLLAARGAGAAGQRALGTAVFGGMIAATFLTVFFVPVFFVMFQGVGDWRAERKARKTAARVDAGPSHVVRAGT